MAGKVDYKTTAKFISSKKKKKNKITPYSLK